MGCSEIIPQQTSPLVVGLNCFTGSFLTQILGGGVGGVGRNACSFQSGNNFSFSLRKGEWGGEVDSPGRKEGEVGVGKHLSLG